MGLRIKEIQVDELDEFTSKQVACYKKIKTCSYALSSFAINLLTCPLVDSSTYLVTLSLFAVDELDEFTSKQVACYKENSCGYVILSSFAINLLTCPLVDSSTYLVTLSSFAINLLTC